MGKTLLTPALLVRQDVASNVGILASLLVLLDPIDPQLPYQLTRHRESIRQCRCDQQMSPGILLVGVFVSSALASHCAHRSLGVVNGWFAILRPLLGTTAYG